ncbi:MAG: hypothetical protein ABEN55_08720 [Bradymonadaceae bacterium]
MKTMKPETGNPDWREHVQSPYDHAKKLGFFAYHGDSRGDHFRKHGLGGWKLVFSYCKFSIERKTPSSSFSDWESVAVVYGDKNDNFKPEHVKQFNKLIDRLVDQGGLELE